MEKEEKVEGADKSKTPGVKNTGMYPYVCYASSY
jgi:hypothetical protein